MSYSDLSIFNSRYVKVHYWDSNFGTNVGVDITGVVTAITSIITNALENARRERNERKSRESFTRMVLNELGYNVVKGHE